jgi:amino acid transporter
MTPGPSAGEAATVAGEGAAPVRHVSVAYVAMVAVAMVVGAGIFRAPSDVAANAGSAPWLFAAWLLGGVLALAGALCYAELASAFPNAGGDYHFLKLAFGRRVAFLFAWARFAVINTGSIALLAFVLGDYANAVHPLGAHGSALYALSTVLALVLFNLKGLFRGVPADYAMTGLEVAGLLIIVAAGVALALSGTPPLHADAAAPSLPPPTFGLALLFVLFAFSGWNEIATLSSEVKDPRRGMVKALVAAVLVITALYVAANWALWRGLGIAGLAASTTPAADVIGLAFGRHAGVVTALAIAFATITSINATIVVGARTTFAAAADWPALARLGRWDGRRGIPLRAMLAQGAVAVLLVGLGAGTRSGFATMIDYTSPVFWLFLTLTGIALFRLRMTHAGAERPFRVPLYPWLPLGFCAASAFVLWSSVAYVRGGALAGLGVLAAGGLLVAWLERRQEPATRH